MSSVQTRKNLVASVAVLLFLGISLIVIAVTSSGDMLALKFGAKVSTSAIVINVVEEKKSVGMRFRTYHMPVFGFIDSNGNKVIAEGHGDTTANPTAFVPGARVPVNYLASNPQIVLSDRAYAGKIFLLFFLGLLGVFSLFSCLPIMKKLKSAPA